ncbi:MAG TPA: sel1 repeat family protein [Planctomycetaceae bacterium]|nr:sel1 repeat family protein [Planctomycetaceae bacterium]
MQPFRPFLIPTLSLLSLGLSGCSGDQPPETAVSSVPLEEMVADAAAGNQDAMKSLESKVEQIASETHEAADSGDPQAAVMTVIMSGDLEGLLPLAESGNVLAMFEWGKLQLDPVDPAAVAKGWDWIKQAADAGNKDAAFMAGKSAWNGLDGFTTDTVAGRKWLEAAAEAGHGEAAFALGTYARYGLGTEVDLVAAKAWYELANENGFKAAADELKSM